MTDKELIEKMDKEMESFRKCCLEKALTRGNFVWGPEVKEELKWRYGHLAEGRHIEGIAIRTDGSGNIRPLFGEKEREFHFVEVSIVKDPPDPHCRIKSFEKIPGEVEMEKNTWLCEYRERVSDMTSLGCQLSEEGCRGVCDKWELRIQNPRNCRATRCILPEASGKGDLLCSTCTLWKPKIKEDEMRQTDCSWTLVAAVERQIKAVNFMLSALKAANVAGLGSACIVELALAKEDLVLALNECRKELTKANEEKGA